MTPLRAHNTAMGLDAARLIARTKGIPTTVKRAADDLIARLKVQQADFGLPEAKIRRSTPGNPSQEDDRLYHAYAGRAQAREAKRRRHEESAGKAAWDWFVLVIRYGPYALIAFGLWWGWRRLRGVYVFLARALQYIVPSKETRRKIAEGTPIGSTFDRMKRESLPVGDVGGVEPPSAPGQVEDVEED
jgi:hypothetical protein